MLCPHCEEAEGVRECFVAHEKHPGCFHERKAWDRRPPGTVSVYCLSEGGPHPDCKVCERCYERSEASCIEDASRERDAARERWEDGRVDAAIDEMKDRKLGLW